jgi:hypothetical protein
VARLRVRGLLQPNGAAFSQSRGPNGEWDLWRVGVRLRPWREPGGEVQMSSLSFSKHTRLPHWVWQLLFLKGSIVEVEIELDEGATHGRLARYLGPRSDPALRKAHSAWSRGRTLEDPFFGRFTFNERLSWFEVKCDWLGEPVSLSLGAGEETTPDVGPARRLVEHAADWDARARDIAADELLEIKNENWLGDDERPLNREEFKARMTIESIGIDAGPYIQFYFHDGDLFAGHTIIVTFDEEQGETWAEFAG